MRPLGETEVVVKDSPGFASSRLGVLLGLEAIRMLEEGVADAEAIDTAMELGYRHPMGPLRSTDLVGLDVRREVGPQGRRAATSPGRPTGQPAVPVTASVGGQVLATMVRTS